MEQFIFNVKSPSKIKRYSQASPTFKRKYNHLEKNLTDDEYKNMEELFSVFEPFFKSTEMLSAEKYCIQSLIWPTQYKLYKKVAHKKADSDFIKGPKLS